MLVVYLGADLVDASAPGVFFFDSALFLGTVVHSKARAGDVAAHPHDGDAAAIDRVATPAAVEAVTMPRAHRRPVHVPPHAPRARDATSGSTPPAAADH